MTLERNGMEWAWKWKERRYGVCQNEKKKWIIERETKADANASGKKEMSSGAIHANQWDTSFDFFSNNENS